MFTFRYGGKTGKRLSLASADDYVAVRTHSRETVLEEQPFGVANLSLQSREILHDFELVARFEDAGVEVLRAQVPRRARAVRDNARAALKKERDVRFAGRVLCDPKSKAPVLYTENFFVKFEGDVRPTACRRLLKSKGLEIKRELEYARNAYFVGAAEGTGLDVFQIAENLLMEESVELAHPELVRQVRRRAAFLMQWHLKKLTIDGKAVDAHAGVESAWNLSEGAGTIIAVIDDGMDLDHEEFRSSGKIVAPRDVTRGNNNPKPGNGDNHGTACAGVACADGAFGASGVAPKARLMPIRFASGLGSQAEADAFVWAAQNGADVISCSWGPVDGNWTDDSDPLHNQVTPLPDSSRLAIEFAVTKGRNGKGCVITWAAGNGNESADNDGYASFEKVVSVAACNDQSKKSAYSDFGSTVWCAFPSNDGRVSLTRGIWTTDRSGTVGYNPGQESRGDTAGNYTNSFGGTSSACPGVAGVAALVLSRNPELRWDEVKDILKRSCDRIDTGGGDYDANGHSKLYGFGRVNARKAVELALPSQPDTIAQCTITRDVPIRDLRTARLSMEVAHDKPLKALRIAVDIEHTYIGDLVVAIKPPAASQVGSVTLHNREGGGADDIKKTYDAVNAPGLGSFAGKSPAGTWTLSVEDRERLDTGKIRSFTIEMHF